MSVIDTVRGFFIDPVSYGLPDTGPSPSFRPLESDPVLPGPVASRVGPGLQFLGGLGETIGGLGLLVSAPAAGPFAPLAAGAGGLSMIDGVSRITHSAGDLWNGVQTESPVSVTVQRLFGVTPEQGQRIDTAANVILSAPSAALGTYSVVTNPSPVLKTLGAVGGVTSADTLGNNVVNAINGTTSPPLLARGLTSLGVPEDSARLTVAGASLIAPVGLAAHAIRNRLFGETIHLKQPSVSSSNDPYPPGFYSPRWGYEEVPPSKLGFLPVPDNGRDLGLRLGFNAPKETRGVADVFPSLRTAHPELHPNSPVYPLDRVGYFNNYRVSPSLVVSQQISPPSGLLNIKPDAAMTVKWNNILAERWPKDGMVEILPMRLAGPTEMTRPFVAGWKPGRDSGFESSEALYARSVFGMARSLLEEHPDYLRDLGRFKLNVPSFDTPFLQVQPQWARGLGGKFVWSNPIYGFGPLNSK